MQLLSWLLWAAAAIVPVICTEERDVSRPKRESSDKKIVCYYTNWSVYRPGTAKFSPQNINPYLCTHLIYAFGGLTKDNSLKPFDKYQDIEQGGYAKFNGLKTYNKNLKTMVAIGGWNEGSARFSPMVADPERRKELVKNTVRFLRQNQFDGLDLDWEYPSFRDGGKPRDRDNYATLVQEFREEFDRESQKTGRPRLLLTMAVPAGVEYIDKGYDVKKLNKYLDWMNILSYDYHSAFEPAVNHHSPLYSLEEDDEYNFDAQLNIDHTVQHYIKRGADRNKLVLGIPTYGRSYTLFNPDATDIGAPADGPGEQGEATREKGYLAYYEICDRISSGGWTVDNSNSDVMGPYAYKGNQWVGYDDENIARAKAKYVNENDLGGIMFWSIDNDDFRGKCHGKQYPLIEAAKEALLAGPNELLPSVNSETRSKTKSQSESTTRRRSRVRGKTSAATESSRTKSAKGTTTTPLPPTTPDPGSDFTCKDEGFFPHPRDCKKYFWCLDSGPSSLGIVAHQFTCPSGLVFNKISDSCDYARNVICKNKDSEQSTTSSSSTTTTTTTTTSSTTTTPRTTVRSRVITAAPPRTFPTTEKTTQAADSEEYEDGDEEEDPGTIKELINLIKKLGGVEQLEKQLSLYGIEEKGKIKPSLYSKVIQGRTGNKYRGVTQGESSTSKYVTLFRNRPNAPQNQGSEDSAEDSRVAEKPRYVTIQRNRVRPSTATTNEEDEEIGEEENDEDEEIKGSRKLDDKRKRKRPGTDATTEKEYVTLRRVRPATEETTTSKYRNIVRSRSTTQASSYRAADNEEDIEDENADEDSEEENSEEDVILEEKEPARKQKKYSSVIRDNKRIVSEVEESKVSGDRASGYGTESTTATASTNSEGRSAVYNVYRVSSPKYVEIRRGESTAGPDGYSNDVNNVNISYQTGVLHEKDQENNGSSAYQKERLLYVYPERNVTADINAKTGFEQKQTTIVGENIIDQEIKRFSFAPREKPTISTPIGPQEDADHFTIVVQDTTVPTVSENDISGNPFIITVTPSAKTEATIPQSRFVINNARGTPAAAPEDQSVFAHLATTSTSTETTIVTSITESSVTERRKIMVTKNPRDQIDETSSESVSERSTEVPNVFRRFRTTTRPSTTSTGTTARVRGFQFRVKPPSLQSSDSGDKKFTRGRIFRKFPPTPRNNTEEVEKKEERPSRFQPRDRFKSDNEENGQRRPSFSPRRPSDGLNTQQSGSFIKGEAGNENSLQVGSAPKFVPSKSRFAGGYQFKQPGNDNKIIEDDDGGEEVSEEKEEDNSEEVEDTENQSGEDEKENTTVAPVQSINDRFFKGRVKQSFDVNSGGSTRLTTANKAESGLSAQRGPDGNRKAVTGRTRVSGGYKIYGEQGTKTDEEISEEENSSDEKLTKPYGKFSFKKRPNLKNQNEGDDETESNPAKPGSTYKKQLLPQTGDAGNSTEGEAQPLGRARNPLFNRANLQLGVSGTVINSSPTEATDVTSAEVILTTEANENSSPRQSAITKPKIFQGTRLKLKKPDGDVLEEEKASTVDNSLDIEGTPLSSDGKGLKTFGVNSTSSDDKTGVTGAGFYNRIRGKTFPTKIDGKTSDGKVHTDSEENVEEGESSEKPGSKGRRIYGTLYTRNRGGQGESNTEDKEDENNTSEKADGSGSLTSDGKFSRANVYDRIRGSTGHAGSSGSGTSDESVTEQEGGAGITKVYDSSGRKIYGLIRTRNGEDNTYSNAHDKEGGNDANETTEGVGDDSATSDGRVISGTKINIYGQDRGNAGKPGKGSGILAEKSVSDYETDTELEKETSKSKVFDPSGRKIYSSLPTRNNKDQFSGSTQGNDFGDNNRTSEEKLISKSGVNIYSKVLENGGRNNSFSIDKSTSPGETGEKANVGGTSDVDLTGKNETSVFNRFRGNLGLPGSNSGTVASKFIRTGGPGGSTLLNKTLGADGNENGSATSDETLDSEAGVNVEGRPESAGTPSSEEVDETSPERGKVGNSKTFGPSGRRVSAFNRIRNGGSETDSNILDKSTDKNAQDEEGGSVSSGRNGANRFRPKGGRFGNGRTSPDKSSDGTNEEQKGSNGNFSPSVRKTYGNAKTRFGASRTTDSTIQENTDDADKTDDENDRVVSNSKFGQGTEGGAYNRFRPNGNRFGSNGNNRVSFSQNVTATDERIVGRVGNNGTAFNGKGRRIYGSIRLRNGGATDGSNDQGKNDADASDKTEVEGDGVDSDKLAPGNEPNNKIRGRPGSTLEGKFGGARRKVYGVIRNRNKVDQTEESESNPDEDVEDSTNTNVASNEKANVGNRVSIYSKARGNVAGGVKSQDESTIGTKKLLIGQGETDGEPTNAEKGEVHDNTSNNEKSTTDSLHNENKESGQGAIVGGKSLSGNDKVSGGQNTVSILNNDGVKGQVKGDDSTIGVAVITNKEKSGVDNEGRTTGRDSSGFGEEPILIDSTAGDELSEKANGKVSHSQNGLKKELGTESGNQNRSSEKPTKLPEDAAAIASEESQNSGAIGATGVVFNKNGTSRKTVVKRPGVDGEEEAEENDDVEDSTAEAEEEEDSNEIFDINRVKKRTRVFLRKKNGDKSNLEEEKQGNSGQNELEPEGSTNSTRPAGVGIRIGKRKKIFGKGFKPGTEGRNASAEDEEEEDVDGNAAGNQRAKARIRIGKFGRNQTEVAEEGGSSGEQIASGKTKTVRIRGRQFGKVRNQTAESETEIEGDPEAENSSGKVTGLGHRRIRIKQFGKNQTVDESKEDQAENNAINIATGRIRIRQFGKNKTDVEDSGSEVGEDGSQSGLSETQDGNTQKAIRIKVSGSNQTESEEGNKGTRVLFRKRIRQRPGEAAANITGEIDVEESRNPLNKTGIILTKPEIGDESNNKTRILLRKRVRNRKLQNEITNEADDQLEAEAGRVIPSPLNSILAAKGIDKLHGSIDGSVNPETQPSSIPDVEGSEIPTTTTATNGRTGGTFVRRGNQDLIIKRRNKLTTTSTTKATTTTEAAATEAPKRKITITERRRFRPETRTVTPKPEVEGEAVTTPRQVAFTRRRIRPKATTTSTTTPTTTTTEAIRQTDNKLEESQESNIPDLADPAVVAIHNLASLSPAPLPNTTPVPGTVIPVRFSTATPSGFTLQYSPVTSTVSSPAYSSPSRPPTLFTRQPNIRPFVSVEPDQELPKLSPPGRSTIIRVKPTLFTSDDSFVPGGEVTIQPRRTTPKPRTYTTPAVPKEEVKPRKPRPFTKVQKRPAAVIETADETQPFDYQLYEDVDEDPLANVPASALKVKVHSDGYIECLDRGNFPHPFSCKKFISCARMENNELLGWEYTCPKHLSFDPVGGICNWSAGLGCQH